MAGRVVQLRLLDGQSDTAIRRAPKRRAAQPKARHPVAILVFGGDGHAQAIKLCREIDLA